MNEAQTITDIRTTKNAIKEGIKKVDTTNYQGKNLVARMSTLTKTCLRV
ncbi:hypothetical protein BSPWISOXPB_4536 [uncultured Gammaproteobacteria bacterium]|nr:hypothetical protein BSPWISOXPB_4536 [uncultured Gammaproteobacteria bacterium]